jgi:hypothetical protein
MRDDLAVSFRALPDEDREFIKAECDAGERCTCLDLAASLALDGYPARFTARLPFVTNIYPGNIFRDDGRYFRGPF